MWIFGGAAVHRYDKSPASMAASAAAGALAQAR